ncbi:MFS transporter [Ferruginibacter lapsinanis]|uniref:MFS transporter n=1 Tax=Ferruginibacter lapsinanis TaxID=563172 RepID=UPI001E601AD6|nr:MFS transporter [Ferruginibacter lapsinanis]UEG50106.1 MFS transporter [Ferruginibacter lapsinanis]
MNQQSIAQPLSKLNIFSLKGVQMKTFHITWLTFFFCFFAWFGMAPLMKIAKEQLHLTKDQIGNIQIASVSATILARLLIGRLVDKYGPKLVYTWLLVICAIPVLLIGTSHSYTSFLLCRLAIGVIGASFVITQFHTSVMFAPNIKGTANATAGGFGNAGGGAANFFMPMIASGFTALGFCTKEDSWRFAMIVPGVMLLVCAFLYYRYTKDTAAGDYKEIGYKVSDKKNTFLIAIKDYRTWILTIAYAACFGVEITVDNFAPIFFTDSFSATIAVAGMTAGIFGWMNIFARPLGGIVADKVGVKYGFHGKSFMLSLLLLLEGIGIIWFAKSGNIGMAIFMMFFFGLSLKMANGATYSLVPFISPIAVGSVAGIVGAGGNIGAMLIAFMFKSLSVKTTKEVIENGVVKTKELIDYGPAFTMLGFIVLGIGIAVLIFRTVAAAKDTDTAGVKDLALAPVVAK